MCKLIIEEELKVKHIHLRIGPDSCAAEKLSIFSRKRISKAKRTLTLKKSQQEPNVNFPTKASKLCINFEIT